MPPPPHAQRRPIRRPAALARALLAAGAAAGTATVLPLAAPVPAGAAAGQPGAPPVSVVIDSLSPGYAQRGHTLTVSGTVTNVSTAPVPALTIQLSSSASGFGSRDSLQSYADGSDSGPALTAVGGAVAPIRHPLAPRHTVHWSVRLPASALRITTFGVYPLAAAAKDSVGATLDISRTVLPFWPGKRALDPAREQIAWIWPLVDQPRQSACGGLMNNGLAASMTGSGRLAGLLSAAKAYATRAHLTWAIDPALLSDARALTGPYSITANGQCAGVTQPASEAARGWLSELKAATARQPIFATPYANVDAVALVHRGLNRDLTRAFAEGRSVASQVLSRNFFPGQPGSGGSPASGGPGSGSNVLSGLAWPPGGIADYPTLQSLGVDGISSVLLDSTTMPPLRSWPPTPSAQATTPDGEGPDLHVLISDHTLTSILGSVSAASATAGGGFAARQYFLAVTAMIAAEAPSLSRSVVVAPPSRWNPGPRLARDLLADTVSAPWLQPVSSGSLLSARPGPGQVPRRLALPPGATRGMLGRSLLGKVHQLEQRAQLLQDIRPRPDVALSFALTAVESSAWRGRGPAARPGKQLRAQVAGYIASQEGKLLLLAQPRVTLGGLKGTVPVSVANHLGYPVRVRLRVSVQAGGSISVRSQPGVLQVPAGVVLTVKLNVSTAAVGSTTLHLRLLTPGGAALPSAPVTMVVQATHYGTLALIIIAAALGVFMLTSATRALRRGRAAPHAAEGSPDPPAPAGPGDTRPQPPRLPDDQPQRPAEVPRVPRGPAAADNVVPDSADGCAAASTDDREDTDEYARSPGRAGRDAGWHRPG